MTDRRGTGEAPPAKWLADRPRRGGGPRGHLETGEVRRHEVVPHLRPGKELRDDVAAGRSTRSKRSTSRSSTSGEGLLARLANRLGPRGLLGCRIAGWVLLLGFITAGGVLGIPSLLQGAMARELAIEMPLDVTDGAAPDWMNGDDVLQDELANTVRSSIGEGRSPALR